MENCEFIGKRDCKKIHAKVDAQYFAGNILSLGTITGTSSICMCISTKFMLPVNSRIELLIPFKKNILTVPVKVNRYSHRDSLHEIMSVEILEPTSEFLEFVKSFDKRTHKRISCDLEIELITNEMNCAAFTKNISERGINITLNPFNSSFDLETEKKFEIKFQIPPGEESLNLFCEKKWSSEVPPQGLLKEVGIEIIDPPNKYIEFLNALK